MLLGKCSEIHIRTVSLNESSLGVCDAADASRRRAAEAWCLERSEEHSRVSVSLGARAWRPEPVKEAPADVQGEFRESPGCSCPGRVPRASWVQMSRESSSRVLGWRGACSRGGSRSLGRDGPGSCAISCSCVTPQTHRNNTFAAGHIPLEERRNQVCWNHVSSFRQCFSSCQVLSD